jgi:Domain of unknown function (DUF4288)
MNWYIAKIVFRIDTEAKTSKDQFDEHLRLIAAETQEEAVLKARMLGLKEEDYFLNKSDQLVKWEFVNVLDVQLIEALNDGIELYSKIFEKEKSDDYIRYVHLRAASLQIA